MTKNIEKFAGLHKEGMIFLDALAAQNDPIFFNANKEVYTKHIKEPLEKLNSALEPCVKAIDPELDTRAKRTLCRIRKDARYAKDNPYRTHMWMSYKPADRSNTDYFTYFFYYDTAYYEIGIGFYGYHKELMEEFRHRIDANPALFKSVLEAIKMDKYKLEGEQYKRPIKKFDLSNPIAEWYNRKGFYVYLRKPLDSKVYSEELVNEIEEAFFDLVPLYDFVLGRKVRFEKQKI
ncbi:MAG: DUF2461 domain-containing protein [Clostridia bacterium]|nr:DUF2461 domain-containing protein [Clostridia bacterium]